MAITPKCSHCQYFCIEYCQGEDNEEIKCDTLDKVFPIEEALVPPLVELVVKELTGSIYKPNDENNNAKDDLSNTLTKQ